MTSDAAVRFLKKGKPETLFQLQKRLREDLHLVSSWLGMPNYTEYAWCKYARARNAKGWPVAATSMSARFFSLSGAFICLKRNRPSLSRRLDDLQGRLTRICIARGFSSLDAFNDSVRSPQSLRKFLVGVHCSWTPGAVAGRRGLTKEAWFASYLAALEFPESDVKEEDRNECF